MSNLANLLYKHTAIHQIQSIAYALHPHTMANEAALTLWVFLVRELCYSHGNTLLPLEKLMLLGNGSVALLVMLLLSCVCVYVHADDPLPDPDTFRLVVEWVCKCVEVVVVVIFYIYTTPSLTE